MYSKPQDGWTVNVKDTDYTYRFNGTDWVAISSNSIPNATSELNGLMTKEQAAVLNKLDNAVGSLQNLTTGEKQNLVGAVNEVKSQVTQLNSDLESNSVDVNGIKSSLSNKVDKISGKGLSSFDFNNSYKSKIDTYLYDSGWVNCGLGYGIVQYGIIPIQVRRIGAIVHLRGIVKNNTSWQEHNSVITIPAGFRPAYEENFIMQGSGSNRYLLTVPSSGACSVTRYSNNTTTSNTVPTASWLCLFATWFTS